MINTATLTDKKQNSMTAEQITNEVRRCGASDVQTLHH
jgi:hypothetical protein